MANAVHLAGPERVHHTTRAMEVLPADASALVICERRWAWVVLGSSRSILVYGFHYAACKTRLYRLPPKKDDHEYTTVLHVIPITTLTHDRHKPVRKKKRNERNLKKGKGKKRQKKKKKNEKRNKKKKKMTRKEEKTRHEAEARKGKVNKMS